MPQVPIPIEINLHTPLWQLKQYVKANAEDGVYCPCCEKKVKVDKWSLNRRHAAMLYKVYFTVGLDWCRLHKDYAHPLKVTSYTIPKYFGLIETRASDDPSLPDSGFWRITPFGERFLLGAEPIFEHAFVLNDQVIFFDEELVSISDVWERTVRFDIRDVLDTATFNLIESKIDEVLRIPPTDGNQRRAG